MYSLVLEINIVQMILYKSHFFEEKSMKSMFKVFGVIALATTLAACSGMSRSQKNTAIGAAVGGVAGNVIGGSTTATLAGAALGGVIGSQVNK